MGPARGIERKTLIACDSCRRKKTRCDSVRPVCGSCRIAGTACVYTASSRPTKADWRFVEVTERLERIERLLKRRSDTGEGSKSIEPTVSCNRETEPNAESKELGHREKASIPIFNDWIRAVLLCTDSSETVVSVDTLSTLGKPLQHPSMVRRLKNMLRSVQRLKLENDELLDKLSDECVYQSMDPAYVNQCIETHSRLLRKAVGDDPDEPDHHYVAKSLSNKPTEMVLRFLMTPRDFEPEAWEKTPPRIRSGFEAAVVLECYLASFFNKPSDAQTFSTEFCEIQHRIALYKAIEFLESMAFSEPSFLLVRCGITLIWLMHKFIFLPSSARYLLVIASKARAIKIDIDEFNFRFSLNMGVQRIAVWHVLTFFHRTNSIFRLEKTPTNDSSKYTNYFGSTSPLGYSLEIHRIYNEMRETLFEIFNGGYSPKKLYGVILQLDTDISIWYSQLPEYYHQTSFSARNAGSKGFEYYLTTHYIPITLLKYYHTLLLIHSIPAFYPDFLPSTIPRPSLQIVTESAYRILEFASEESRFRRSCGYSLSLVVTTAVGTLLCRQLRYPQHQKDNQDNLEKLQKIMENLIISEYLPFMPTIRNPAVQIWKELLEIMSQLIANSSLMQSPEEEPMEEVLYPLFDGLAAPLFPDIGDDAHFDRFEDAANNCTIS